MNNKELETTLKNIAQKHVQRCTKSCPSSDTCRHNKHKRGKKTHTNQLCITETLRFRRFALEILGDAGDLTVLDRVEALLADPSVAVRTEALLYLARHADVDPLMRVQDLGDGVVNILDLSLILQHVNINDGGVWPFPLPQKRIAEILGVSQPAVSMTMNC